MTEAVRQPTLSHRATEHLENLLDIEASRRPIDAALRSPVVDGRDALLCAATNLECGQPQCQPRAAMKLRAAADLLIEMDVARSELIVTQQGLRFVRGPQLRQLAERVRVMAHDDADLVANSLLHIANSWTPAPAPLDGDADAL